MFGLRCAVIALAMLSSLGLLAQEDFDFDDTKLHEIRISFSDSLFWENLEHSYRKGVQKHDIDYLMANVQINGASIAQVGVRLKGIYSNQYAWTKKKPIKLSFNAFIKGGKFSGLKKLNLANSFDDPSFMREILAYGMLREAGVPVPRVCFAKVYLNDEYWGLYQVIEQIDDRFLKRHYPNMIGQLYKSWEGNLDYLGEDKGSYKKAYEQKEDVKGIKDYSELIRLTRFLSNSSKQDFQDSLELYLDVDQYLRCLALDVLLYNEDSYSLHTSHNYYLYFPANGLAAKWIPWDYNLAFSPIEERSINIPNSVNASKILIKRLGESKKYRHLYFTRIEELNKALFSEKRVDKLIGQYRKLIEQAVIADKNKLCTTEDFEVNWKSAVLTGMAKNMPGIMEFVRERQQDVKVQAKSYLKGE